MKFHLYEVQGNELTRHYALVLNATTFRELGIDQRTLSRFCVLLTG